jgi:hypothetical protein
LNSVPFVGLSKAAMTVGIKIRLVTGT